MLTLILRTTMDLDAPEESGIESPCCTSIPPGEDHALCSYKSNSLKGTFGVSRFMPHETRFQSICSDLDLNLSLRVFHG